MEDYSENLLLFFKQMRYLYIRIPNDNSIKLASISLINNPHSPSLIKNCGVDDENKKLTPCRKNQEQWSFGVSQHNNR